MARINSKSLIAAAAVAGLAGLVSQARQAQAGPILFWDFNNVSGNAVNDSSGSGHGGTFTASGAGVAAPTATTPPLNSSTKTQVGNFDGTAGAVTSTWKASDLGIGGNNPKSVSVWVNAASASWTGAQQQGGPFEIGADTNLNDFSLRVKGTGDGGTPGDWRAQFWGSDVDFTVAGSQDKWTHFVLIYDPTKATYTDHTVNVFANGTRVAFGDQVLNTLDSPKTFAAGQWTNGSTPKFLQGQIDDVAVYNSVLTQSQVTALFNGTSPNLVPEPASLGLAGAAAGLLLVRRRRGPDGKRGR